MQKKSAGFINLEIILYLSIALLLVNILVPAVRLISLISFDSVEIQNRLGIIQIRKHLNYAYYIEVYDDYLEYYINDKQYTLSLVNNRLIQQPGTLIFMLDLQEVEFFQDDFTVYLKYLEDKTYYEQIVTFR